MANPQQSFEVPYRYPITGNSGLLTRSWEWFFRLLWQRLYALGEEKAFTLVNSQASPADIVGLRFDKGGTAQATVDFVVQRVTTGGGAVELIESGSLILSYNPTSEDWNITETNANDPDDSGITFTITATGQVQYVSTNEAGTPSISRIVWRARTLGAKHTSYSVSGGR